MNAKEAQREEVKQQQKKKPSSEAGGENNKELVDNDDEKLLEGLPVESSPYVKYSDVEDYKRKGYGTQGHLQPKLGLGGGATDAPTPSGSAPADHPPPSN